MVIDTTVEDTINSMMEKIKKKFKNPGIMIPMRLLNGNFIKLPLDMDYKDLKKFSKGKRKLYGFYVKICASKYTQIDLS